MRMFCVVKQNYRKLDEQRNFMVNRLARKFSPYIILLWSLVKQFVYKNDRPATR